ncbi:MAG: GTPase domain-containing protein [Myxococcota bacterium]|nr:GTPase domain-containing protein [Myxococcota bacterium]
MAKISRETAAVNARIVYWGVQGAGKTANLRAAFSKLRPDHRGQLREVPSRLDPTVTYEVLPMSLGEVGGIRTQIEMVAVPGSPEQAPTRKQLLDQVDGVVFVVDASAGRVEENLASFEELQHALAAYGRSAADMPLVLQYNKRDVADAYALDDLHRKLQTPGAPVFEAVATDGTGVLQTLSTISKRVIRALREQSLPDLRPKPPLTAPPAPAPAAAPAQPGIATQMEQAILADANAPPLDDAASEAATLLHRSYTEAAGEIARGSGARLGRDLSIVSVGTATRAGERAVRVPVVLGDGEGGTSTLVLTIQLETLVEGDPG